MIFYQILNTVCFSGFIVNMCFIFYLRYYYEIPRSKDRYMFLSFFKNLVGAIAQLYTYDCAIAWYMKSFAIVVIFASFFWCLDTREETPKKINKL